jgi:hypothetical protein
MTASNNAAGSGPSIDFAALQAYRLAAAGAKAPAKPYLHRIPAFYDTEVLRYCRCIWCLVAVSAEFTMPEIGSMRPVLLLQ